MSGPCLEIEHNINPEEYFEKDIERFPGSEEIRRQAQIEGHLGM